MGKRDFFHTGLQVGRSQIQSLLNVQGPGDIFYVDYRKGADTNDGETWETAFRTYSTAIAAVTSDNNDVILIDGDSTVVETAMVNITKNRVHTIGMNGTLGHYGQGAKISLGVTAAAADIATIQNTGIRNTFTGIKVINSNTVAEGLYGWAEGGEFTRFSNCEFFKDTDLDENLAAEFLHNGDSTMFYDCTFGSTANIIATAKIRPNVLLTATLAGKKCRDTYFENCLFFSKAGGTAHVAVYGGNATDVERMLLMNGCMFINNALSAATPAHAVGFGSAQTQGTVLLKDCAVADHTVMAQASVGITVAGAVPTFATTGVGVTA
jgi:hypothetical protein